MKTEITYTNAGGGTVLWSQADGWKCLGCGDTATPQGKWGTARDANDHASQCRAQD
ncbi:hypothetical protein ABZ917_17160 [Nonomuraea wenchangensis]